MRIGLTTDVFPPRCGGSGWSAFDLARGLRERGHDVRVLKLAPGRKGVFPIGVEGIDGIEWGAPDPRFPGLRSLVQGDLLTSRLRPFLVRWFRENRFEVVHAQHRLVAPATIEAADESGIASILTVRDYWPVCFFGTSMRRGRFCTACTGKDLSDCLRSRGAGKVPGLALAGRPFVRHEMARREAALARASAVLVIGSFLQEQVARTGLDARLRFHPNFVDSERLAAEAAASGAPPIPLPAEPFLAFAGKLTEEKGTRELAEVMAALGPGARLVVAGDGPLAGFLEERARGDGWALSALGWVERPAVAAVLARSRALVFPSLWPEPLGRCVLEAQALGRPVIAFDRGGPRDILVDGETGTLAESVADFTVAAKRLLADAALADRLGRKGRERVAREFGSEKFFSRLEAVYAEVKR